MPSFFDSMYQNYCKQAESFFEVLEKRKVRGFSKQVSYFEIWIVQKRNEWIFRRFLQGN